MLAHDAGFTDAERRAPHRDAHGGRRDNAHRAGPDVTQTSVPEVPRNGNTSKSSELVRCGAKRSARWNEGDVDDSERTPTNSCERPNRMGVVITTRDDSNVQRKPLFARRPTERRLVTALGACRQSWSRTLTVSTPQHKRTTQSPLAKVGRVPWLAVRTVEARDVS